MRIQEGSLDSFIPLGQTASIAYCLYTIQINQYLYIYNGHFLLLRNNEIKMAGKEGLVED